jgi:hypothetical protein
MNDENADNTKTQGITEETNNAFKGDEGPRSCREPSASEIALAKIESQNPERVLEQRIQHEYAIK